MILTAMKHLLKLTALRLTAILLLLTLTLTSTIQAETKKIKLRGYYEQQDSADGRWLAVPLGLKFKSNTRVDMLSEKKKFGKTCTYKVSGNSLVLTHACGVKNMTIEGNKLIEEGKPMFYLKVDLKKK